MAELVHNEHKYNYASNFQVCVYQKWIKKILTSVYQQIKKRVITEERHL